MKYVDPTTLKSWIHDGQELALLDVREHGQFGEDHLFFAIPLPYSMLEAEVERLAPRKDVRVVLYGDDVGHDAVCASYQAMVGLGYTRCHVLHGGIQAWKQAGYGTFAGVNLPSKTFGELAEHAYHTPSVTAHDLHAMMQDPNRKLVVLDGRPVDEYRKMNIPGAICCPNGELPLRIQELVPDPETTVVINCAGRTRSIIGAQTLVNLQVPNPVFALENGTQGWFLADLPLEHGSSRIYPERISEPVLAAAKERAASVKARFSIPTVSAAQVAQWLQDQTKSVFLCDVRTQEEFRRDAMPAQVQHTPGGQLIQATDQYIGVRNGCIVLCDMDGVRAPVVASWLKQLGWDVHVLPGHELDAVRQWPAPARSAPVLKVTEAITPARLAVLMQQQSGLCLLDTRQSMQYRKQHVQGARWAVRPTLAKCLPANTQTGVVLMGPDAHRLAWLAHDVETLGYARVWTCAAPFSAFIDAGFTIESSPDTPPDAQCIDYLFFVHDRHDGNKAAARQYLEWETNLIAQLDDAERNAFVLNPDWAIGAGEPAAAGHVAGAIGTRLVHLGKSTAAPGGKAVNPALVRASTVVFDSMAQWKDVRARRGSERLFTYGARGTPTTFALEDAITELEGGYRTRLLPTGLAAIAMMFVTYLRPGQHVLITDACYQPVRHFAQQFLDSYGIEYSFFAADGTNVQSLIRPNTRMIYAEAPGSLVYEMLDLPQLAQVAKAHNALLAVDNTWGSGLLYRPLALGADISVMAATKYLGGHSDTMMGSICTTQAHWAPVGAMNDAFGMTVSPDDAWLVLRGVRTLSARLKMHQEHALRVVNWLGRHPRVARVFCPALPGDPGHALWKRDCSGTNGLISFELKQASAADADAFLDALSLFGLGASWGGYESLASAADMKAARTVTDWSACGPVIRLHIGLEDPDDLIADLERALATAPV